MTMIFKECSPEHGIRSPEEDIVVAVDPETDRLLHYQKSVDSIALPLVCCQGGGGGKGKEDGV